jgi:hypothetical protein
METLETIKITPKDIENPDYNYQLELTEKLDKLNTDFNQNIINEIVLWKVNRYAKISKEILLLINHIKSTDTELNLDLTKQIMKALLQCKGVKLAMASTILRFKNPNIYQIIDQRVYRFITGNELKYSLTNIDKQIGLYLDYIIKLKNKCKKHNIDFEQSDRIIYEMDKKYNKNIKIKY